MKRIITIVLVLATAFSVAKAQNQNVGINTDTPDPSAVLEIQSDSKGLLIPRLTTVQREAIVNPANALMVFDTDEKNIYFYDAENSVWSPVLGVTGGALWGTDGTAIYSLTGGNVGIGNINPEKNLHIQGNGVENVGLALSAADSLYSVIIEIDETNDGFELIGTDGLVTTSLMYIDKNGRVGYNNNAPEKSLHIKGDGVINPSIALTNQDSSYSVIIEIDETNDAFQLQGSDGVTTKDLMNVTASGQIGFGTAVPQGNLEVKGDAAGNPTFVLSNENDDNYVIIEIDETNDGIEFIGNNDGNAYTMLFADNVGKIGIGTTAPEEALHVQTSALSDPAIKLTKDGYAYEYSMGIDATSNSFVVKKDTVGAGTSRVIELEDNGDITLNAGAEIKLQAPLVSSTVVKAEQVTLEVGGATADITVQPSGEVLIPGLVRNSTSYLDFGIEQAIISSGAPSDLLLNANGIVNASPVYTTATNTPNIQVTEAGIYEVSYSVGIIKAVNADTEIKLDLKLNTVSLPNFVYYFHVDQAGNHTLSINSRLISLSPSDVLTLSINIESYVGATQNFSVNDTNSYMTVKKVAD